MPNTATDHAKAALSRGLLPEILTSVDLAVVFDTTPCSARRLVRREGIPHVVVARKFLVRRAALDAWLKKREMRDKGDAR